MKPTTLHLYRPSLSLLVVAMLTSCGGGSKTGSVTPGNWNASQLIFERANSRGGSDLYRAPLDDSAGPVNMTRHTVEEVLAVWPKPVENRIVYVAGPAGGGIADFYSVPVDVPPGSIPGYTKLTTQSLGIPDQQDWQIINGRLVVRAQLVTGAHHLYSFAVDGSDFTRLTEDLPAGATITWPRDAQRLRNAVTDDGKVVFEATVGNRQSVWCVHAAAGAARELSRASSASLARDMYDRPMVHGNTVVLRESNNSTTQFRARDTNSGSEGQALTWALAAHEQIGRMFVHAGHFVFEVGDTSTSNGIENLYSIALSGPTGTSGLPITNNLTNLNVDGSDIGDIEVVPGTNRLVLAAEVPGNGGVQADVLSVRVDLPQSLLSLTRPAAAVPAGDIAALVVCRDRVVFGRRSQTQAIWTARIDQAGSDSEALPAQAGNVTFIAKAIRRTILLDPITHVELNDPGADPIDAVVLGVTNTDLVTSKSFTNFFRYDPTAGTNVTLQLTDHRDIADGPTTPEVRILAGRNIVYMRSSSLFAASLDVAGSEKSILPSAMAIDHLFEGAGQYSPEHVLLSANGQLFSTRVDRSASEPGALRQLTSLVPQNEQITDVHFNMQDRVVFGVTGLGRTRICAARRDAQTPQPADISEAYWGTDEYRLSF